MAEMKNICGKIPMDLHEKVREEIELTESSTQKLLQQVIEEHFNRVEGKGEISMGAVRTILWHRNRNDRDYQTTCCRSCC